MELVPLHDRVLVKRVEAEEMSGPIIIPEAAKEKPMEGLVVSAGPGRLNRDGERVPMQVTAGDRVLFGKYAGQEVKIEGDEHVVVKEDEILGIIRGVH